MPIKVLPLSLLLPLAPRVVVRSPAYCLYSQSRTPVEVAGVILPA